MSIGSCMSHTAIALIQQMGTVVLWVAGYHLAICGTP